MVYLPTFTIILPLKTTIHVGKYTSPMDPSWVLNFDPIQDVTSQMCNFLLLGDDPIGRPPGCAPFVTSSSSSRTLQTTGP